jgi:hypothetical protein
VIGVLEMQRYSVIKDKNPREIVLLRGCGCRYKRCVFCDYHDDASANETENLQINKQALDSVTGEYGVLEVINSGSFCELEDSTLRLVEEVCEAKSIGTVHFECHWLYRHYVPALRERFAKIGVVLKIKTGVETFDADYREHVMLKGIRETSPERLSEGFDECCLLFGLPEQTVESMIADVETGLRYFSRVCVNIMVENSAPLKPDLAVRELFIKEVYPKYKDNPRVDILLHNTDFGVGA